MLVIAHADTFVVNSDVREPEPEVLPEASMNPDRILPVDGKERAMLPWNREMERRPKPGSPGERRWMREIAGDGRGA
jgi:hypothetical protein